MSDLKLFNQTIQAPATQKYVADVLGEKKSSFTANLTSLVANNKALQECEPITLLYAGIKATALNLPLDSNLGFAYVIPYKNNKEGKTEAQFQLGYKGLIQLAIRSGQFKNLNVTDVREGELKHFDLLSGTLEFEAMPGRDELPVIGYVAFFELCNGFTKCLYMTKAEVDKHATSYSQTYSSKNEYVKKNSKWTTDFDIMAKKTVIKLLLSRYAPLSVEMQQAITFDQSVQREANVPTYVDNEDVNVEVIEHEDEFTEKDATNLIKVISKIATKEDLQEFIDMNTEALSKSERLNDYVQKRLKEFDNGKND